MTTTAVRMINMVIVSTDVYFQACHKISMDAYWLVDHLYIPYSLQISPPFNFRLDGGQKLDGAKKGIKTVLFRLLNHLLDYFA